MKIFAVLFLAILFASCNEYETNKNSSVREYAINSKSFIELKKEVNYTNRFKLIKIGEERILFNLSKSGTILMFNLEKGTVEKVETNIVNTDFDGVRYESDNCQFVYQNILFNFDYKTKSLDSIVKVPLKKNEFIIHNLYSENVFKYNSYYYLQFGNENGYNRLSEFGLQFFNKDTSFKFIETPNELKHGYIHYNDMCVDNIGDTFYYTYATSPLLHRINLKTKKDTSTTLKNSKFIAFDTTKVKDMKYIYDYTFETTYNVKLLCTNSNVYIIQRFQKKNKPNFKLFQYDQDLKLKSEFIINHTVDPNFIYLVDNKLVFISFKDKKIYEYEVD